MSTVSLRQIMSMAWLKWMATLDQRRMILRLIWCQRNIRMHQSTIRNEQEIIRLRSTEKINLRTALRDLGIDPDVVAPEEVNK